MFFKSTRLFVKNYNLHVCKRNGDKKKEGTRWGEITGKNISEKRGSEAADIIGQFAPGDLSKAETHNACMYGPVCVCGCCHSGGDR